MKSHKELRPFLAMILDKPPEKTDSKATKEDSSMQDNINAAFDIAAEDDFDSGPEDIEHAK